MPVSVLHYINPLAHLGEKRYSILFPILSLLGVTFITEFIVHVVLGNPSAVSMPAIFLYMGLIIYFSFRSGIRGGVAATIFTLTYYVYIMYEHKYTDSRLRGAINTTVLLGLLYFLLSTVIGYLRQTIDTLIEREVDAKKWLMTVIRQLPVGVILADSTGAIIEVNNQFSKIVGHKPKLGIMIGQKIVPLRYPRSGEVVTDDKFPLMRALRDKTAMRNHSFVVQREGKDKQVLVSSSPVFNSRNEVIAGVSIYQDVTAMREIEKRKDDFVNMASHELRTPVTSLVLYLEILKRRFAHKEYTAARSTITNIEKQTQNLTNLINTLLDVSRHQTGKMRYSRENFQLDDLIHEAVDALQDASTGKKITILRISPVTVHGDRYRIYQVLTNLITNAMKYSSGSRNIEVSLSRKGKLAQVSVKDYGIGIPKGQHKKIFERLYQVHGAASGTYPGLGMGLYISREILKRHSGKIWVESEEGKGSTFYFTLPRVI